MHPCELSEDLLLADCRVERLRGRGPGGQHRNKVETGIRLTHRPTGTVATALERRQLEQNRARAVHRLRVALAVGVRTPGGRAGGPSARWRGRVGGGRIAVNPAHDDFPPLLAEAMDAVTAAGSGDVAAAAAGLGVSTSQLVKLLKLEPAALERVNQDRAAAGRPRLR